MERGQYPWNLGIIYLTPQTHDIVKGGESAHDSGGEAGAPQDRSDAARENEALRELIRETILNVESLVEDAERVLRRAKSCLAKLGHEDD
jgi:hypothetical protein